MPVPKRYFIIIWLCTLFLVFPLGCVRVAKTIPPKDLGSIAIVHGNFTPEIMIDKPAKGWLAGAGRGSANWVEKVFAWPFTEAGPPICSGQGCGLALLIILALTTTAATIGGMAGGVVGAVKAEPAKKVDEAENIINEAITKLKIQETFRDHVVKEAQKEKRGRFTVLEGCGPTSIDQKATYGHLADRGIETILQISIVRFGLIGKWEVNPPLQLEMAVQVKIIQARDDKELYSDIFQYTGESRKFSEWCADNAQALKDEFKECYSVLAEDIISITATKVEDIPSWMAATGRDEISLPKFSSTDELDDESRKLEQEERNLEKQSKILKPEALETERKNLKAKLDRLEGKKKQLAIGAHTSVSTAHEIRRAGRFIVYDNGTVLDKLTNLMWTSKDNGHDITVSDAKSYCENYSEGGYADWRMPTQDELEGLYNSKTKRIKLTNHRVWASDRKTGWFGASYAYFNFFDGKRRWIEWHQPMGKHGLGYRVLPVRSSK